MNHRSSYRQLLPYLQAHWLELGLGIMGTLGFVVMMPLTAYLVGQAATVLARGQVADLAKIVGLVVLVFLIRGVCAYIQDTLMARATLTMVLNLRCRIYQHLHSLSLDYFETAATGDLTYRLTEDIDRVGEMINRAIHEAIPAMLTILALLSYLIYLNWPLTLTTLTIAPLIAVLVGWFGNLLLHYSRKSQQGMANLASILTEALSGMRLVKAFAAEAYEIQRFKEIAQKNLQASLATERVKAIQHPVISLLEAIGISILFLVAAWQIAQQQLTSTGFISFGAGFALLIDPIQTMIVNYNLGKQTQASLDRVLELLQIPVTVPEKSGAKPLPTITGRVEFCQVCFAYAAEQPVLHQVSFLAHPGEVIALVGPSGAGKTTLINLLARFYDPQQGQILIDGIDIQEVTLTSLRQQMALVPQETILFSGTIAENIAFGHQQPDLDAVQRAAKIANADEFINQFSQGYFTWVGERGVNLSGGQQQRLAIARALYRNPKILILDEATSALDTESESLVQEALERVMEGRTVFIIAHRLSTVRRASRILVLEQGQVVESGTHVELLNLNGGTSRYARFYTHQFPA